MQVHDYEHACEDYFCNMVSAPFDPTQCGAGGDGTTLVITTGTQTGFFQTGSDIGSMNPHDYRPNEVPLRIERQTNLAVINCHWLPLH